jgi:hypothetical protein
LKKGKIMSLKPRKRNRRRRRTGLFILLAVLLLLVIGAAVFTGVYYHADGTALRSLQPDDTVAVIQTGYGWLFDGPSDDRALIFYPGGKVEETAYAPLLHLLAAQGMDVCLVQMPLRLAVLDQYAADEVMKTHDYAHWYIGGHSLGGAVAALYAAKRAERLEGVILLAAYPTKQLPDSLCEILLVGSEDRVVNQAKLESGRLYAPACFCEHILEGGNHAQFGSYGPQKGDGTPTISAESQVEQTVALILADLAPAA